MPLSSRATTARAERATQTQAPADVQPTVQPRRGKGVTATENAASASQPVVDPSGGAETTGAAAAAQNAVQATQEAGQQMAAGTEAAKAPRKPRAPREPVTVAPGAAGAATDTKSLKERLKAIEKEFKLLIPAEQQAMREVSAKFKTQRLALESEHRLITGQLSASIFHG